MTIIVQITETTGVDDSIIIHKPKMFYGFTDPEFMDYVNNKVNCELNPPNMNKWMLDEVTTALDELVVNDSIKNERKRGRPKGSVSLKHKKKDQFEKIDETFMEFTE